jgi:hypothetical protein
MKMNSYDKIYCGNGVDLSAWTAAFVPSLLSDPPRVFNSSRPPTQNTGRAAQGSSRRPRPYCPRCRQALSWRRLQENWKASNRPRHILKENGIFYVKITLKQQSFVLLAFFSS